MGSRSYVRHYSAKSPSFELFPPIFVVLEKHYFPLCAVYPDSLSQCSVPTTHNLQFSCEKLLLKNRKTKCQTESFISAGVGCFLTSVNVVTFPERSSKTKDKSCDSYKIRLPKILLYCFPHPPQQKFHTAENLNAF